MRELKLPETTIPRVMVAADPQKATEWLAGRLVEAATCAVRDRGRFRLALSGGTTPLALYRLLVADNLLPWGQCDFWMVDERFVPDGHPDHNGSTILSIFSPVIRADTGFKLIDTAHADARQAALAYEAEMQAFFGLDPDADSLELPVFDFILLGMGADAHTASLFPGTGAVEVADCLALEVSPLTANHDRVTLSRPVLMAARQLMVLATGTEKAPALRRVLIDRDPEAPAAQLAAAGPALWFVVDEASAANLA